MCAPCMPSIGYFGSIKTIPRHAPRGKPAICLAQPSISLMRLDSRCLVSEEGEVGES
jgi:hypothetical protein